MDESAPDDDGVSAHGPGWSVLRTNNVHRFNRETNKALAPFSIYDAGHKFSGDIAARFSPEHSAAHVRTSALKVDRARRLIAQEDGEHHYKLVWQIDGEATMEQDGATITLRPGDAALYSIARPYRLMATEGYRILSLRVDLSTDARLRQIADQAAGTVMRATRGLGAARSMLTFLFQSQDDANDLVLASAARLSLESIERALKEAGDQAAAPLGALPRAWLEVIDRNLADPAFSPERLATIVGVSRRSLYETFARRGVTPAAYIRDVRLERSRGALIGGGAQNLAMVAHDFGFHDETQFSRAFRRRFGHPPGRFRRAAQAD